MLLAHGSRLIASSYLCNKSKTESFNLKIHIMKKILCLLVSAFAVVALNAQDDLKEYVGTYRFPDGSQIPTVEVKLDNGILVAYSPAGSSPLEKMAKDTFSI